MLIQLCLWLSLITGVPVCEGSGGESAGYSLPVLGVDPASSSVLTVESNDGQSGPEMAAGPPEFTEVPDGLTKDPFARFAFQAYEANDFECRLDDGVFEECESPHTVFPLATGPHKFYVRLLTDSLDELTPIVHAWKVSSIFPDEYSPAAHDDLIATDKQPALSEVNSWRGIFRINCDFAHSSYDDPIVYPGQNDAAHLHRFYGNTLLNEDSDVESLFTTGESSCQGNELNRSAYWVPALLAPSYDSATGQRLFDDDGEPAWKAVPAVVGNDDEAHEVFYYSAGVGDLESIQPIPLGLKIIAGDHSAVPGSEQDTTIVRWHCQSWESSDAANPRWSSSIPECRAPDRVRMDIFFPSCWNGLDLDSFDHKSHLTYPVSSGGPRGTVCPATHPVPLMRVSFHYAFGVKPDVYDPNTRTSRGWKLASDRYDVATEGQGGMSLHGDWFNAWYPEALQAILDTCIRSGLDCHDGNLANGYRLSGTRAGTQFEPPIYYGGMGDHM